MKKTKSKEKREYYILAGEVGIMDVLIEADINVSPTFLLVVKQYSKIGKLIEREAKKQVRKGRER